MHLIENTLHHWFNNDIPFENQAKINTVYGPMKPFYGEILWLFHDSTDILDSDNMKVHSIKTC